MSSDDDIDLQPGEGEHVQGVGEQVHGAEEPVQDEGVAGELHQGEVAVNTDKNSKNLRELSQSQERFAPRFKRN